MSFNGLELVLYDLGTDKAKRTAFKEDAAKFLSRYPLDDDERQEVAEFDVKAMTARGVNTMLTMGYWQMTSPDRSMRSYLKALNS
jgi:hypothetical protein